MDKDILLKIELPKGWAKATISEMISADGVFVDGDWIESKDQDQNGDVRLIQLADIGDGDFRDKSSRFLTLKRANEIGCTFLLEGDILVARMPDPIGRACLFPLKGENKYVTAVDVAIIRTVKDRINNKLLNYFINSPIIRNKIEALQSGTTRKRISRGNLSLIEFPFPPLNEQNRIVDKLDELLSELEKGKEQLLTSLEQLKVYRQSILKHAFENTKRFPVGDLYDFVGGGTPSKRNANYWKGNIPWASVKDIKGDFLTKTQDKISEAGLKDSASNLAKPNDVILITRIIPGRPIIAKIETAINQDLKIVKPKVELIPKFIYYTFKSIERECLKVSSGTTVLGINLVKLKEINIPYLEFNEQELVVQEIDRKLSECDKLEEAIILSLSQSEITKKSLLQKAFEGKLVEQDPTDEPASVLLERIKKEREEYLKLEKERKKIEKPLHIKSRKMEEELKRIIEILKESKEPVSAKTLWQSSTHKDDIDDFYAALKKHIEAGEIIELPRKGKESFLKLADAK